MVENNCWCTVCDGVDRLALKVSEGVYLNTGFGHKEKGIETVDRKHAYVFGLVIERRRGVGGDARHIYVSGKEIGGSKSGIAVLYKFVFFIAFDTAVIVNELCNAHSGRSVHISDFDFGVILDESAGGEHKYAGCDD